MFDRDFIRKKGLVVSYPTHFLRLNLRRLLSRKTFSCLQCSFPLEAASLTWRLFILDAWLGSWLRIFVTVLFPTSTLISILTFSYRTLSTCGRSPTVFPFFNLPWNFLGPQSGSLPWNTRLWTNGSDAVALLIQTLNLLLCAKKISIP